MNPTHSTRAAESASDPQPRYESQEEIIRALRAHAASGGHVSLGTIQPPSLVVAAYRRFGSFAAALNAADLAPPPRKRGVWSGDAVITGIRQRQRDGKRLNCTAVLRDAPSLYHAGRRYLGSWDQALRAAGVDPAEARASCAPRDPTVSESRRRYPTPC